MDMPVHGLAGAHEVEQDALMSVKMALAKLCVAACGGAIVSGGALHVASQPDARPANVYKAKKNAPARVRHAKQARVVKRVRRVVTTSTACAMRVEQMVDGKSRFIMKRVPCGTSSTVETVSASAIPLPPMAPREAAFAGGGGGAVPIVVGGSGGGGFGGGFFAGGFFGGSGGGGGSVVVTSTTSGGSTSTSTSSGGSGGSSSSTSGG
ncbi:MAG: hypothetical protein ACOYLK_05095, partial [Sphingomonas sp.]